MLDVKKIRLYLFDMDGTIYRRRYAESRQLFHIGVVENNTRNGKSLPFHDE